DLEAEEVTRRIQFLGLPGPLVKSLEKATATSNLIPVRSSLDGEVIAADVVAGAAPVRATPGTRGGGATTTASPRRSAACAARSRRSQGGGRWVQGAQPHLEPVLPLHAGAAAVLRGQARRQDRQGAAADLASGLVVVGLSRANPPNHITITVPDMHCGGCAK